MPGEPDEPAEPNEPDEGPVGEIEAEAERERLRELVDSLDERHGLIVRTAGEGRGRDEGA